MCSSSNFAMMTSEKKQFFVQIDREFPYDSSIYINIVCLCSFIMKLKLGVIKTPVECVFKYKAD